MNKRNAVVQKSGSPEPERSQFSLIDEELLKLRVYAIRGFDIKIFDIKLGRHEKTALRLYGTRRQVASPYSFFLVLIDK